jgi:hypothetical protein
MNESTLVTSPISIQPITPVNELYAVTVSGSVYHLTYDRKTGVDAKKIFAKEGSGSLLPVGQRLGDLSQLQQMISLGNVLIPYIPERNGFGSPTTGFERRVEHVSNIWRSTTSSSVVGYFENREDAERCATSDQLKMRDPRWLDCSKQVLSRVGDQHPRFYIPTELMFAFR